MLSANAQVETLSTQVHAGTDPLNLSGNGFAQAVIGNYGANVLSSGGGSDTLIGLAGSDTFLMNAIPVAGSVVTVADFIVGEDRIALGTTQFGLATGALAAGAFVAGASAADADDRILYDGTTGRLWFDVDGNGAAQAVLFAAVTPGVAMTVASLLVVP